jgi:hypothetical protein
MSKLWSGFFDILYMWWYPEPHMNSFYQMKQPDLSNNQMTASHSPLVARSNIPLPWNPPPPQRVPEPENSRNIYYSTQESAHQVQNYQTIPGQWVAPPPQPVIPQWVPEPVIPIFPNCNIDVSDFVPQVISDTPKVFKDNCYLEKEIPDIEIVIPAIPAKPAISATQQRVRRFEHELEQIRNKELDHDDPEKGTWGNTSNSPPQPDKLPEIFHQNPDVTAIPEVFDPLTPAEIMQLDIWFPNGVPKPEISNDNFQPTPNQLADNRLLVDNHFPITNKTHSGENRVIELAPRTPEPKSLMVVGLPIPIPVRPAIPATCVQPDGAAKYKIPYDRPRAVIPEARDSLTPAENDQLRTWFPNGIGAKEAMLIVDCVNVIELAPRTEFHPQPGIDIPTLAPPFVKPHQPATWNPHGKGILEYLPPAWEKTSVSNDDPYQIKEIPDQETAQNVLEERKLTPPPSYYWINSSSQKSPLPIPLPIESKPKLPPINNDTWWKKLSKWLPARQMPRQMHLPDDTNPVIIWDTQNGIWKDTSI